MDKAGGINLNFGDPWSQLRGHFNMSSGTAVTNKTAATTVRGTREH